MEFWIRINKYGESSMYWRFHTTKIFKRKLCFLMERHHMERHDVTFNVGSH